MGLMEVLKHKVMVNVQARLAFCAYTSGRFLGLGTQPAMYCLGVWFGQAVFGVGREIYGNVYSPEGLGFGRWRQMARRTG